MKKILFLLLFVLSCSSCSVTNKSTEYFSEPTFDDRLWQSEEFTGENIYSTEALKDGQGAISFWIKPMENKSNTTLFFLGDENTYIQCISSGYDKESYSGISIVSKNYGKEQWVVADGIKTLKTNRYNYIVVNIDNNKATIYLDGEEIVSGNIENIKKSDLYIGTDAIGGINQTGAFADLEIYDMPIEADKIKKTYEDKYANVLLDTIKFNNQDDCINAPWLVDYVIDDVPVKWASSDEKVMSIYGKINPKSVDTVVTMTATIDSEGMKGSKSFDFTIKAINDQTLIQRDLKSLNTQIQYIQHSGNVLADVALNGSTIQWDILSGNAIIENNHILKTSENEEELITLKATISLGNEELITEYKVLVLDEVVGYVLSYFNGELGEETGKLAYSLDGLNWTDFNHGKSIITSALGNGRIRDPFISRDKNGDFVVLATEGFDNPEIYVMHSKDLVEFTDEKLLHVAYYDKALQMSGKRAWAPEFSYDMQSDQYVIYFSDPGDKDLIGHIYGVTTSDFENVSYPYDYYNPGYNVIDGTILPLDGQYWLLYKDERKAAQTIFYASSTDLLSGFGLAYDSKFIFDQKYIEGPFVVQKKEGGYYLYVDYYPQGSFFVAEFNHLGNQADFNWLEADAYNLPEDVRHGSAIGVTQKELNRMIEAYN